MKTAKSIIALLLVFIVMGTSIPVSAVSSEDGKPNVGSDMAVEGTNTFSQMLAEAVDSSYDSVSNGAQCNVLDVEIQGKTAKAIVVSDGDYSVSINICDENTGKVLGSGVQSFEQTDKPVSVPIDIGVMPEHFVVEAEIIDDNENAISALYRDQTNTTLYEELEEKTIFDFDSDYVINLDESIDTNFAVLSHDVTIFSQGSNSNTLTSVDEEKHIYTLSSITNDVRTAQEGDLICIGKDDVDSMVLGRIKETTIKGNTAVLELEDESIENVFDAVKIEYHEAEAPIIAESASSDITVSSPSTEGEVRAQGLPLDFSVSKSATFKVPFTKQVSVSATFKTGIDLEIKEYKNNKKQKLLDISVKGNVGVSFKLEVKAKTPWKEKPLGTINIPTPIPGLSVKFVVSFQAEFSVALSYTYSISVVLGVKATYNHSTKKINFSSLCQWPSIDQSLQIDGKFKIGLSFYPAISALNSIDIGIKATVGIEVTATLPIATATTKKERHNCLVCFSFKVDAFFKVEVELGLSVLGAFAKYFDVSIVPEISWHLFKGYWSASHKKFGSGSCPYYSYECTFKVVNQEGKPISNVTAKGLKFSKQGVATQWMDQGTKKITFSAPGYKTKVVEYGFSGAKTFTVTMNPGSASDIDYVTDASVQGYKKFVAANAGGGTGWRPAPLTFTEPEEGVVLSTKLAGQRRSDVAWVQRELNKLGYTITADGYYGNTTAAIVRQFQKDYSLPITGVVNANVVAVIKKPIKPVTPPVLRLMTNPDIPSGGIVTVAWDNITNADDYNVYAYNSQGELAASAVETKANTASFVLYEAGEYTIKAISENERFTSKTVTLNQKIYVHNPSRVTFIDWDNAVLSKQFVEYGKSATSPASPERDGYTFNKWIDYNTWVESGTVTDADYSNLTDAEMVIMAWYTPNSYSVKFMDVKASGSNSEKILTSDKYLFGESAQAPDKSLLSIPDGYSFIGWDRDYSNITEDIIVRPVLQWDNNDLPILIETYSVAKDEGYGYDVSLTIRNYEKKRTTGRVVVALKTEEGRFITMTESSAFTLAKSNISAGVVSKEDFNVFVPCNENVAYVDIFVVAAYSDLIPISEVKRFTVAVGEQTENEGTSRAPISGYVEHTLAGKQAILFIYKIDEAADFTNEYIGQSVIGADGSFSFDYRLREEPTAETGDYTVVLGIEGADGAIFLDTIQAPRKQFKVTIQKNDGSTPVIQYVQEGDSAVLPDEIPEREGYRFAGWDYSNTSIHEDITITALYVPKTYTVVFIDWTTERFDMKTYQHGEPIDSRDLSLSSLEEYDALGWEGVTEGMPVTENMVITAKYEKKQYLVKFYDYEGHVIEEQIVSYGDDAIAPVLAEDDVHIFYGWDEENLTGINAPLDVHPHFSFAYNTSIPTANVETGVYNDTITVSLFCDTAGAEIYYSLNDGAFTLYTTPIQVDQTTKLIAYASSFGRNNSEPLISYYAVNRPGEDLAWKVPVQVVLDGTVIETYLLDTGSIISSSELPVSKPGSTLEGFYYDAEMTQSATGDTVNNSIILYSNFVPINYTVQFLDEDGTILDTQTVAYLESAEAPKMLISVGDLVFVGWDTEDYLSVTNDVAVTAVYAKEDELTGITLNHNSYTMMEGYTHSLKAKTTGSGIHEVFWESSDDSIASVDETGTVTAHRDGFVIITATILGETTASATCYVSIERNPAYSIVLKAESDYSIVEDCICGISPSNNTVGAVKLNLQSENAKFYDGEREMSTEDMIKTGCTVSYYDADGNELDTLVLVVTGDVDGNGSVNAPDASHIMRYIIGKENLDTCFLLAADVNADGNVNNRDASLVLKVIAQKESI